VKKVDRVSQPITARASGRLVSLPSPKAERRQRALRIVAAFAGCLLTEGPCGFNDCAFKSTQLRLGHRVPVFLRPERARRRIQTPPPLNPEPALPKLAIIVTSTRDQRAGPAITRWFAERVAQHGKFEGTVVDLKAINLPLLDEPNHPMKRQYQHPHTKAWSEIVAAADAFAFVMPEYNYGMPPALLNALDYLYFEWNYKPAGFVSYGGISGGTRSVQMSKQVITSLKMMPLPEAVSIPFFAKLMDPSGVFQPGDSQSEAATKMLDELLRWTTALKTLRP
jgi:NAD(P)H-dependent FMN reductase